VLYRFIFIELKSQSHTYVSAYIKPSSVPHLTI